MRLLMIAPACGPGKHQPVYVKAIADAGANLNWRIDLVTPPRELEHPLGFAIRETVEGTGGRVIDFPFPHRRVVGLSSWIHSKIETWGALRKAWRQVAGLDRYEAAFVMDGDYWYVPSAIFGAPLTNVPIVTVILGLRFIWGKGPLTAAGMHGARLQQWAFEKFIADDSVAAVCTVVEALAQRYNGIGGPSRGKVRYVPDVGQAPRLMDRLAARRALGWPETARMVVLAGILDGRKGLNSLMMTLADPHCPLDICAGLLGPPDEASSKIFERDPARSLFRQGRLFLHGGVYSEETLAAVLSAADAAWLKYEGHLNSSSFLWEAAQAGLPVLGCAEGAIGSEVYRHGLGLVIESSDPGEIAKALDRLTRQGGERSSWRQNCLRAGSRHTPFAFGQAMCQAIAQAKAQAAQHRKPRQMN